MRTRAFAAEPNGHRKLGIGRRARRTGLLRLPQHDQLPTPYREPHCGHPTRRISSMNGTNPAEIRRAPPHAAHEIDLDTSVNNDYIDDSINSRRLHE